MSAPVVLSFFSGVAACAVINLVIYRWLVHEAKSVTHSRSVHPAGRKLRR